MVSDDMACAPLPHTKDEDCYVTANGLCIACAVEHGDPCAECGKAAFHAEGCRRGAEERHGCNGCSARLTDEEIIIPLEDTPDLGERLDPGHEVASGECPKCGSLTYLLRPPSTSPTFQRDRLIEALRLVLPLSEAHCEQLERDSEPVREDDVTPAEAARAIAFGEAARRHNAARDALMEIAPGLFDEATNLRPQDGDDELRAPQPAAPWVTHGYVIKQWPGVSVACCQVHPEGTLMGGASITVQSDPPLLHELLADANRGR